MYAHVLDPFTPRASLPPPYVSRLLANLHLLCHFIGAVRQPVEYSHYCEHAAHDGARGSKKMIVLTRQLLNGDLERVWGREHHNKNDVWKVNVGRLYARASTQAPGSRGYCCFAFSIHG